MASECSGLKGICDQQNVVIVLVTAVVAMAVVVGQPARSYWYHSLGWTPSEV